MQRPEVQKLIDEALARQRQQFLGNTEFNRNLRLEQIKASVKSPADKRAVSYLADEEFDWNDFFSALNDIVTQDNNLLEVKGNEERYHGFATFCVSFANMRKRKNLKESEAYKVASRSQYGWLTEKYFRQGELFESTESGQKWYEKEEISAEKKLALYRSAEREAKFAQQRKAQFERKRKPTRWGPVRSNPPTTLNSDSAFVSNQLRFPPVPSQQNQVQCFGCGETGHIRRNCPKNLKKN